METSTAGLVAAPRGFRRVAPAFALFFMSPFVAEFLLGDFSLDASWIFLVLAPMYGGGALVVRETTRRLGRGWPTMLLFALAYGLFEEGIVIQTLFNPNYLGLHLLSHAYIPALGMGAWWTVFVLTIHTVWSMSVPIAVTEGMFPDRRTTPWLGRIGLAVSLLLLVLGALILRHGSGGATHDRFVASAAQLTGAWVAIAIVVALALCVRPAAAARAGSAPGPWTVGVAALVLGLAFMNAHHAVDNWPLTVVQLALDSVGVVLLWRWSCRTGWTALHTLAAAAGAMLVYAYNGFPQQPVAGSKGTIDLIGNTLFAAIAIALLVLAIKKQRTHAAGAGPAATSDALVRP